MKHLLFLIFWGFTMHCSIIHAQENEALKEGIRQKYNISLDRIMYEGRYEDEIGGFYYVQVDDYCGMIDSKGKIYIKPSNYTSIFYVQDGYFLVGQNGRYGICSFKGKELLFCGQRRLRIIGNYVQVENMPHKNTYIPLTAFDGYHSMGKTTYGSSNLLEFPQKQNSEIVKKLKQRYPGIQYIAYENKYDLELGCFYYFQVDGKCGICDDNGKVLIEPTKFTSIFYAQDGYFIVAIGNDYGIYGFDGSELLYCGERELRIIGNKVDAKYSPDIKHVYLSLSSLSGYHNMARPAYVASRLLESQTTASITNNKEYNRISQNKGEVEQKEQYPQKGWLDRQYRRLEEEKKKKAEQEKAQAEQKELQAELEMIQKELAEIKERNRKSLRESEEKYDISYLYTDDKSTYDGPKVISIVKKRIKHDMYDGAVNILKIYLVKNTTFSADELFECGQLLDDLDIIYTKLMMQYSMSPKVFSFMGTQAKVRDLALMAYQLSWEKGNSQAEKIVKQRVTNAIITTQSQSLFSSPGNSSRSSSSNSSCSRCGGTGEIIESTASYVGGTKWCNKCNKEVSEGHYHTTCPVCGGKGY